MRVTKLLRSARDKLDFGRPPGGAPPGTLIYTGRRELEDTHVHLTYYDVDQCRAETVIDALPPAPEPARTTWFDVRGLHRIDLVEQLGRRHGMHPLALEDVVDVYQRPKMESYREGILLIVKAYDFDREQRQLSVEQVSIYLTENTVLTFQEDGGDLFAPVRERLQAGRGRIRSRGADYLAYALVDSIVDGYFTVLDALEESLDAIESSILREPRKETKSQIHDLRLSLLTMRKSIGPTRELTNRLGDTEHALVSEDTQLYVRDLRDHVVQVTDLVETYRDVTNGLYDLYVSEISFRTNSVVQTLTVVSAIFIPLSFLAGVYGMNFTVMPGTDNPNGFWILCGAMAALSTAILILFRWQRWI